MPARFSYIDAKGKEVEIGGTAQLMQRIRLGAIDGATQLHDAASDRWAPAEEHPIYAELRATVAEEAPLPAPPPEPTAPPPETEAEEDLEEVADAPLGESAEELEDEEGFEDIDFQLTVSGEEAEEEGLGPEGDASDLDLADLALAQEQEGEPAVAEVGEEEAPEEETVSEGEEEGEEGGEDSFDFPIDHVVVVEPEEEEEEEEEEADFDFGSEPLTLEEAPEAEEEELEAEATEAAGLGLESPLGHLDTDEDLAAPGPGGFEEGDLISGAAEEDWSTSLEAEEPEEVETVGVGAEKDTGEADEEAPERPREKRARPERPPPRQSSSLGSILTLIVFLAVLGGGGWLGYTFFLGGSGTSTEDGGPGPDPRATRTVSPDLQGPMVSVAEQAMGELSAWISGLRSTHEVPERPPEEWLDGIYLAHASEYPGVEEYFSALRAFVREVRSGASGRFLEAYEAALAGTDLSDGNKAQLRGWIQEDVEWSQFKRDSVYAALEEVTGGALDLHALLVEREDDIGYELLEAVPADPALQSQIDGHLDRITDSLDDLDALGQVTASRFEEVLEARLRRTLVP